MICRACYRSFHYILNNPKSLDCNFKDLITNMQKSEEAMSLTELDSCVQYSLIHTTRIIATSLLHNEAILLSEAYQNLSLLNQVLSNTLPLSSIHPSSLTTKCNFHQHLVTGLHEHLECITKHQQTGTILLRRGGDITLALSHSLAANYKLKSSII